MAMSIKIALLVTVLIVAGGVGYAVLTVQPADNITPVVEVATSTETSEIPSLPPDSSPLPPDSNSDLYIKVNVVSIDTQNMKIVYKPYALNTIGGQTEMMSFPENIPVYRVDDDAKLSINQERVVATLGDIKSGLIVYIKVENKSAQDGKFIPQAFVVISEKYNL